MKISKKILAIVLAAIMIFSVMPLSAFAKEWTDEDVRGWDLRTGDILTSDVEFVHGLEEYTLTLLAGGYGDDFEVATSDVVTSRWSIHSHESPSGRTLMVVDRSAHSMYFPYDANGMTNRWYVVDVDHDNETIILSGFVPSIPTVNTYTATWKNYDGAMLKTDEEIEEGTTPTYFGKMPAKPSTDTHFYAFSGWTPAVEPIAEDTTYTATFTEMAKSSTVDGCETFVTKSFDDTRAFSGEHISAANPKVSANDLGWSANTNFRTTVKGLNGEKIVKLVLTRESAYGAAPVVYVNGTAVSGTLSGDVYTFDNLNATSLQIGTGSNVWFHFTDLVAYYKEASTYTVTWKNWDGSVLETDTDVVEDTVPTYDRATPTKADDAQYTYTFAGWTPAVTAVSGDVTYTATYTATAKMQPVAEVNGTQYATLEEAIAAANAGDTVKLLADIDFTVYPAFTRHTLDLTGVTLDLDGHTITGYNHSVVYVGDNFTIKNGKMVCVYDSVNNKKESYAAVIYPQEGNWQTDVVTDKSTGVVLENLVLTGGINCFGADVTVRGENTNVTGNYYYALWADVLATLTVEDGTFTSAASSTNGIIGACSDAGKEAYVYISGGDYTVPAGKNLVLQSTMASSQQLVEISGGTYNVVVPAKACAEGFVPVTEPNAQGKYVVEEVQAQNGSSLTLTDGVKFNAYIDADAYGVDADTAVVKLTYNHNADVSKTKAFSTDTIALADATKYVKEGDPYDGTYKFAFAVAPAQYAEDITIALYANADAVKPLFTTTTSVKSMGEKVIALAETDSAYTAYANLCKALADYCQAAQVFFSYDAPAAPAYYNDAVTTLAAADMEVPSAFVGIEGAGFSFTIVSALEVNVFYNGDLEIQNVSIDSTKGADAVKAETTTKGGKNCINITGIASGNLDNVITVNTSAGVVELSATNIAKAIAGSANTNYANLARALYLYSVQASAFFGA